MAAYAFELELECDDTPGRVVRHRCSYKGGPWETISESTYRELLGNWDYEFSTIKVVD